MSWFSVNLLFRAIHNEIKTDNDLWEERIIVINAVNEQAAKTEGLRVGKLEEHGYSVASRESHSDNSVKWSFVQIERVCEIEGDVLVNGLEVFTRYLRNSEVESLLTPFDQ
jgi:hypothetical protein